MVSNLTLSDLAASSNKGAILFDTLDPPVDCGEYEVVVEQTVTSGDETLIKAKGTFSLSLGGPRTELLPEHVLGSFPPAGARDVAWNRLPHVALTRRTLPWERNVWDEGDDLVPWMCLLVLREGEYFGAGVESADQSALPKGAQDAYKVAKPPITGVRVIRVGRWLLQQLLPYKAELGLLCHARLLPKGDNDAKGDADGFVAMVMSNRICAKGVKHLACLVSLEGQTQEPIWPDSEVATGYAAMLPHALVVLHSWEFTTGEKGDFEDMIRDLRAWPNSGVQRLGGSSGAVTLQSTDRDGNAGEVRYQGPLIPDPPPTPPAPDAAQDMACSADEILANSRDPRKIGHASAFEIGRLLTLANPSALLPLRRFRAVPWVIKLDTSVLHALSGADLSLVNLGQLRAATTAALSSPLKLDGLARADRSGVAHLDASTLAGFRLVDRLRAAQEPDGALPARRPLRRRVALPLRTADASAAESPFNALIAAAITRDET